MLCRWSCLEFRRHFGRGEVLVQVVNGMLSWRRGSELGQLLFELHVPLCVHDDLDKKLLAGFR